MRTLISTLLVSSIGALALAASAALAEPKRIAVTAIIPHPALDSVFDGLRRGLAELGHSEGQDIALTYEHAGGNLAVAARIARRVVSEQPEVIVAISTPSAQAAAGATREIPIVFAAVTDPLAAGLVASAEEPGGNITGVSDMAPVADHLALVREITPEVRRLGILYNPREANSRSSAAQLITKAEQAGIQIVEGLARTPAEVADAVQSLVGRADAIFVPTDNTVTAELETVAATAIEKGLALYAADTNSVGRGALAATGFDYEQIGIWTAAIVDRVLKGEDPGRIPVVFATGADLYLNQATAAAVGVEFPPSVLTRATKIVE
jgi:putative ABC transport system substrate-binding protein